MTSKSVLICLTVFMLLLAGDCLLADTIIMKDGRKLEGKIIKVSEEEIEIQLKYGTMKVSRSRIEEIIRGKTKQEEYEEKLAKIDKKDKKQLLELAKWCTENDLDSQRKKLLRDVLKLDPSNDEAGKALGYVKKEEEWVKPAEKKQPKPQKPAKHAQPKKVKRKQKSLDAEPSKPVYDKDSEEAKFLRGMSDRGLQQALNRAFQAWEPSQAYLAAAIFITERNDNSPGRWLDLAWSLMQMGDYPETVRCIMKGFRLGLPEKDKWAAYQYLGNSFSYMRNFNKAVEYLKKSYEYKKNQWDTPTLIALNYIHMEKYKLAEKYADEALNLDLQVSASTTKAICLAVKGEKTSAENLLKQSEEALKFLASDSGGKKKHGNGNGIFLAEAYCALGNTERALFWLEEHVNGWCKYGRDKNYAKRFITELPLLKTLHNEERYKSLTEIPEELDQEEWEYGLVEKGASIKKAQEVSKLEKKAGGENLVPPILPPKGWMAIKTKNYVLLSNSLRERLKELAYRLELIHFEYMKFFGTKTRVKEIYTVKMFKNREGFLEYAKKHGATEQVAAYFSYKDKELVLYDTFSIGMGRKTFGIIYHEAAHQFIHNYLGEDVPIWFHEAVAQYFEAASYASGRFKVGIKDIEKAEVVRSGFMNNNQMVHISDMLQMTRDEFYSGEVELNYATAYSFLYYLLNYDASTKKLLADYVKALKEGKAKDARKAAFGKVDIDELQKSFRRYIVTGK